MKTRVSIMLAVLVCFSGLLLAPGVKFNFDPSNGDNPDVDFGHLVSNGAERTFDQGGAWRFSGMASAINSTLNNLAVVAFGFLIGTLLTCCLDPAAKEEIFRGIKSACKRPSRSLN